MIEWHLEKRKIKDLKDYSKNPRRLTKEQATHLQASLDKFGLIDKPIINADGTIIGGHQRVKLLRKNGIKEVECHVSHTLLSDEDVAELNIRMNRNQGIFDWDVLANCFECEDLLNWGFIEEELIGDSDDAVEIPGKKKKEKKCTTCPSCGHEF